MTNNAHMFYLVCRNGKERSKLIEHLKQNRHCYSLLHLLATIAPKWLMTEEKCLKLKDMKLIRLPLWPSLTQNQVNRVTKAVLFLTTKILVIISSKAY